MKKLGFREIGGKITAKKSIRNDFWFKFSGSFTKIKGLRSHDSTVVLFKMLPQPGNDECSIVNDQCKCLQP